MRVPLPPLLLCSWWWADGGRTRLYDDLRGADFWPPEYDGRAVVNDSFRDHEGGDTVASAANRELYRAAEKAEDFSRLTAFA